MSWAACALRYNYLISRCVEHVITFLYCQPTLESTNTPGVFASGDACHNVEHPRSKAGVFAVRAG